MKQVILILFCSFLFNSHDCFSQKSETKIKYVYGYSYDLNGVTMGITFEKIAKFVTTPYYIRFRIDIPSKEYRNIYLPKNGTLTFLSKSGNTIDLKLGDVGSLIKRDPQTDHYTTTLTIPVTREELVEIGSEPFYRITLPYIENSSKKDRLILKKDQLIFTRPALLIRRNFTQTDVKYILII